MMTQNFEHYLLTCFNVNRGLDPTNRRNSPDYLDGRFAIFESVTIPSVEAQKCSNFTWLVFFDIDTPESYKNRLKELAKSSKLLPVYVKNIEEAKERIQLNLDPKTDYLVTTNLDNDDAIADNFIEILQANFLELDLYFLNFMMGYMADGTGLYMREYYSSPFHTLSVKRSDEMITCLDVPHPCLYQLQQQGVPVYHIVCQPTWLQIVHGTNVQNKIETNAVPIFNLEELKRFHPQQLPFTINPTSVKSKNRLNVALNWFKRKKKKPLSFRLKLALYTLMPSISILYNQFKWRTPLAQQKINQAVISPTKLKELIANLSNK